MSLTYLQTIRCIKSRIFCDIVNCSKAYYCEKKKLMVEIVTDTKEKTCIPVNDSLTEKSIEQTEKAAFDNEDEIMQVVLTEKERDASVRSRLSKECSTLLADKKNSLCPSGLSSHMDHYDFRDVGWENYPFEKTVVSSKKHLAPIAPVVCAQPAGKGSSPLSLSPSSSSGSPRPPSSSNRIVRGEPGKVLFCVIPEEWWKFFMPKTGVTGFFTFLFTFGTFLISKEYYVLEHNYYGGLSFMVLWYYGIKHVGPPMAKYLDNEVDNYEKAWQKDRDGQRDALNQQIEHELLLQHQCEGQMMLVAAKRENVLLQLEAEFRKRQMYAYEQVKNRLDYHFAIAMAHRRIIHKNLVDYVIREVKKSITPDMQSQLINISIKSIVEEFEKNSQQKK